MLLRSIFVSLPLILTFLAANICDFLIATLIFFMFFSFTMNFASFLFFFWFCFVSFALALSPFSVIGVSVMVVGGNSRTHDHVIMKFSLTYRLPFFFSHVILILYYGKWLIINSAIFSNSCPVIAKMHILN